MGLDQLLEVTKKENREMTKQEPERPETAGQADQEPLGGGQRLDHSGRGLVDEAGHQSPPH